MMFTAMDVSEIEKHKSAIENSSQSEPNFESSARSLSIRDLVDTEPHGLLSVSAVLHYCKCKILRPYLRLLSIMGLRPIVESTDHSPCTEFISILYTVQVILFVICGHVLQYMACFRRDRGFRYETPIYTNSNVTTENICNDTIIFSFIVPSVSHFLAYSHAIYLFRNSTNENLSNLMERVFLNSSNPFDGFVHRKKLVKILWLFVGSSLLWMILSFVSVNLMMAESTIKFKWLHDSPQFVVVPMKILLLVCTLWHDMIQATIITSYCLQAQLLSFYLNFLRVKLVLQPVRLVEWMKELLEFKNLLRYLNENFAPVICVFTIINLSWGISGVIRLLDHDYFERNELSVIGVNGINVLLWMVMAFAPFIQAARLTSACQMIRGAGHEVRTIPYAHRDTPSSELDSALLYTSSLRLNAQLFCIPISWKYLSLVFCLTALALLVLGQCHFLHL